MTKKMAYQRCVRCVMDTTDFEIQFDLQGVCNHCKSYEEKAARILHYDESGQRELKQLVEAIKLSGKEQPYDCVIGISGGVDSTYIAYLVKQLDLRPLAVHLDNGWDSELAVNNIEKVLKRLEIDLYTYVLDWEEFKRLQRSFLEASVPDAEIPTDHAIGAIVYRVAVEHNIKYVISGSNIVTEGILPSTWTYGVGDWHYIKSVSKEFGGSTPLKYPHYSFFDLAYYSLIKGIKTFRLLDYHPYIKSDAMRILQESLGWQYYGGKHYESIYTRFFQGYILPRKFNIDKRKAHLSTLICSGQMTREEALHELNNNPYTQQMQLDDRDYVIKKLGLTENEFEKIMKLPVKSSYDYPTMRNTLEKVRWVARSLRRFHLLPGNLSLGL